MDISKAKKLVELEKDGRKILVTLWEGNQISSCVTGENNKKQYCESCQGDDELCRDYVEHLKSQGYEATEVELEELEIEEGLPKFMEERKTTDKIEPAPETEVIEHADIEAAEAVLGSPGELQPGESRGSSPEIS